MRGGQRTGAGRPSGAITKKTRKIAEAVSKDGITPLEFLMSVMRDETKGFEAQMDAAKAAAPYVHAKLAAVAHSGEMGIAISTKEQRDAAVTAATRANS